MTSTGHAIQIFNDIASGKDGTLDITGRDLPEHGCFVGGVTTPLVFESVADANRSTALNRIHLFVALVDEQTDTPYIGWWLDEDTGKVWVDASTWYADPADAAAACRERGEIAFYDIATGESVRP